MDSLRVSNYFNKKDMAEFISTWAPAAGVAVIAGVGYAMFQSLQPPVAKSRAQTPKSAKAAKQTKETVVVSSTVHAKGTAPGPANAEKRRKKASVHACCLPACNLTANPLLLQLYS